MTAKAFQDYYPDHLSYCYGCGRLNEHGLHIKSYWEGEGTVCRLEPAPHHIALPGYVYGGLIASLFDCHSTGTAAAAGARAAGLELGDEQAPRYVTAALNVSYLRPTPLDTVLEVRSTIAEVKGRKVVVQSELWADGELCAKSEVVAVQAPEALLQQAKTAS